MSELAMTPDDIDISYVDEVLSLVKKHDEECLWLIKKSAPRFELDQIPGVHVAILKVAIVEMKYVKNIPEVVALNEGIEMAKVFTDDSGKKFVNGVLDSIKKAIKTTNDTK